jgi:hypothetical protein
VVAISILHLSASSISSQSGSNENAMQLSRTSLLAKFELMCAESRKLHFAEELQIRGIRLVKDH